MPVADFLLDTILQERFGIDALRPKQKEVIEYVLSGDHTLALLPTGYGKSLCYQLPSQTLDGVTLVVSPLIALMRDQVEGLRRRGIKNATVLNSTLSFEEQSERINGIKGGAFKLVYVAPERFESPRFRALLAELRVALLVIDEAHCISQWGHDFRPQYRNLSNYLAHFPGATILAVTATATQAVQQDIVDTLGIPMRMVVGSFDRPNLRFEVEVCRDVNEKDRRVLGLLSADSSPAIVYTSSRREAERVAQLLKKHGVSATHYHAGMPGDRRESAQRRFESDSIRVIVSTVAFGMGVDKPDIRRVIHFNMAPSLENYYQEAGRAGRDGGPATCTLLYQPKDISTQRWLLEQNYPSLQQVFSAYKLIKDGQQDAWKPADMASRLRVSEIALNSALVLLREQDLVAVTPDGEYYDMRRGEPACHVDMGLMQRRRLRDQHRLDRMIDYAKRDTCRRQAILAYFGQNLDSACSGCDVCQPRAPVPLARTSTSPPAVRNQQSTESDSAILQAVKDLHGLVGRTTVAGILTGSRSKKILESGLNKLSYYGALRGQSQDSVLADIDRLIAAGYIVTVGDYYPKVQLSEKGQTCC